MIAYRKKIVIEGKTYNKIYVRVPRKLKKKGLFIKFNISSLKDLFI